MSGSDLDPNCHSDTLIVFLKVKPKIKLEKSLRAFLSSADFFFIFFSKILSGIPSVSNIWIQIRADVLSGLIWVKTVCTERLSADDTRRQRVKSDNGNSTKHTVEVSTI